MLPAPLPSAQSAQSPALQNLLRFFETLSPDSVAHLAQHYASNAAFKDPFNQVTGVEKISPIFSHMFSQLDAPRFVVTTALEQSVNGQHQAFLTWDFLFKMRRFDTRTEQCIKGASHIVFDAGGLVCVHRDYWDAAEELYEKLPVLGSLMRWLKRKART